MWPLNEIERFISDQVKLTEVYSVVVIDIDYFTRFCLKFDKSEIDSIIDEIYKYFVSKIPKGFQIWRSGGDEFLICCPLFNQYELEQIFSIIRRDFRKERFAKHSKKEFSNVAMTFSAGIASHPADGSDIYEIIRKATVALFLAKALRRNRVCLAPCAESCGKYNVLLNENLYIEVVLGNYGEIGYAEEVVDRKKARLWEPQAIDLDADGNIYIADQNNSAILKYDGSKVVRIAGNGLYGYSGDGGFAIKARLNRPTGLTIHGSILYITDTGNDVIRKVSLESTIIETIAGIAEPGYTGDNESAVSARLNKPGGIAVDKNNNLYINDIANNVIRRVDSKGTITTYAGTGDYGYYGDGGHTSQATFGEIYGIGIDRTKNALYLADYYNHCIRKIDIKTGIIQTIAGTGESGYSGDGGSPSEARLDRPVAICLDADGNIYIAESGNSCIRVIRVKKNRIYTLVGDGVYGIGKTGMVKGFRLTNPNGITVDIYNNLYILDGANNRVCKIQLKFNGR